MIGYKYDLGARK